MPRQARLDAPGTLHHVIVRGIERRDIVSNDRDRYDFVDRLGNLASETGTRIYAWALMPNHAHILLKSAACGLSHFMRRLLTGYAVAYNLRHGRHGHLFQNRYKSIVCEEETYFKELVRYIHLNPLRAYIVSSTKALEQYRWGGHSVVVGKQKHSWQDRRYVLDRFGRTAKQAITAYRRYIEEGVGQGERPELAGGGLVRSQGGPSQVLSMRRAGIKERSDERILGSGAFVEKLIREDDAKRAEPIPKPLTSEQVRRLIEKYCREQGLSIKELTGGSRRKPVTRLRAMLTLMLIREHGLIPAEVARQMGVSMAAVSKIIRRSEDSKLS